MACEGVSEKGKSAGPAEKGKKKPATLRCGLKSNSLRRKLEETGVTLMLRTNSDYFISQISVIRFTYILSCSGNQLGLSASGLILSLHGEVFFCGSVAGAAWHELIGSTTCSLKTGSPMMGTRTTVEDRVP